MPHALPNKRFCSQGRRNLLSNWMNSSNYRHFVIGICKSSSLADSAAVGIEYKDYINISKYEERKTNKIQQLDVYY